MPAIVRSGVSVGMSRVLMRRVANYEDPRSAGSRLRARRAVHLLALLAAAHERYGRVQVLDVGGRRNYWEVLPGGSLQRFDVHVTVVNLPGEAHPADDERFRHIEGDGCDLAGIADSQFHICHANSVLEHVGDWSRMTQFAQEVRRVAPWYVVQTPYFWFPIEPHFMAPVFHWLPEPWRIRLMLRLRFGRDKPCATLDEAARRVQSARLVDRGMFGELFPDAAVHPERIAGLTKSLVGVRGPAS